MKWLPVLIAALLAGCATQNPTPKPTPPPLPPAPSAAVRKAAKAKAVTTTAKPMLVQAKSMTMPNGDPPLFHVNYGPNYNGPMVAGVDATGTNMVLIVPAGTPMLYVPNKTGAPFALFQSSPDLTHWTTLGYMTNFVNGFYIADVTSTNQPKYFYRLAPQ